MTTPAPIVEVFVPRQAPHLAPVARSLEPAIAAELDQVLATPAIVQAFAEAIAEQSELDAALARFRRNWWRKFGVEH